MQHYRFQLRAMLDCRVDSASSTAVKHLALIQDVVQGSQLCSMCDKNTTNLEDGSSSCPVAFIAGSSPSYRYAVVVSFGVLLNGTALDDIASKVLNTPPSTRLVGSCALPQQSMRMLLAAWM